MVLLLWFLAEVAIAATDLAEIIGSATALNLLFNIPLWAGVLITAVDVLFLLIFGMKNFRILEVLPPFLPAYLPFFLQVNILPARQPAPFTATMQYTLLEDSPAHGLLQEEM